MLIPALARWLLGVGIVATVLENIAELSGMLINSSTRDSRSPTDSSDIAERTESYVSVKPAPRHLSGRLTGWECQEVPVSQRRRRLVWGGAGVAVVAAIGITLAIVGGGSRAAGSPSGLLSPRVLGKLQPAPPLGPDGYEGVPVPDAAPLAGRATMAAGQKVDGISCQSNFHLLFHWHAALTIFVNGEQSQIPAGVGIIDPKETKNSKGQPYIKEGKCFYWLHTHAPDGVIHIESPVQRGFTLGDFFDEWGLPLSTDQVGPAKGHVTVFYYGKVYQGNPRDIPLVDKAQIQLDVGTPLIAPDLILFPKNL